MINKQHNSPIFPFVISAVLLLLVEAVALLNAFTNIFAPWGHGFAIGFAFLLPFVWICFVCFNMICYKIIKPFQIPRWTIILPAIVPIINIISGFLLVFAQIYLNDEMINTITSVSTGRMFCVIRLVLCIPFIASSMLSKSVHKK